MVLFHYSGEDGGGRGPRLPLLQVDLQGGQGGTERRKRSVKFSVLFKSHTFMNDVYPGVCTLVSGCSFCVDLGQRHKGVHKKNQNNKQLL